MQYPSIQFLTNARDPAWPAIPTLGHPAAGFDRYRTVEVLSDDISKFNICFTDVQTIEGLRRVLFGQVVSYRDIDAAETALLALLFHENIEIIIPTIKVTHVGSVTTYLRPDQGIRTDGCFELFETAIPRDQLCAIDYCEVQDDLIRSSLKNDPFLVGQRTDRPDRLYAELNKKTQGIGAAMALELGVPGYFHTPFNKLDGSGETFLDRFYRNVGVQWKEAVSKVPSINVALALPPLLSIVLDRAANRDYLPHAIKTLREDLSDARAELAEFNYMVESDDFNQVQLEQKCEEITAAFNAAVPESRVDAGRRFLARIWSFKKPMLSVYSAYAGDPTILSPESLDKLLQELNEAVRKDPNLAERTVTSSIFSKLLRTDSMKKLISRHFTEQEIKNMARTQNR